MQYESNDCETFRVFLNTLDVDTLTRALHRVIVVLKLIYHDILRDSRLACYPCTRLANILAFIFHYY